MEVFFAILAAGSLLVNVLQYRHARRQSARDDRAEEKAERGREARDRRDVERDMPIVVVEHAGSTRESGGLERLMVRLRIENKGPTNALILTAGIDLGDQRPSAPVIPALSPGQSQTVTVIVPLEFEEQFQRHEIDGARRWVAYTDQHSNPYEVGEG